MGAVRRKAIPFTRWVRRMRYWREAWVIRPSFTPLNESQRGSIQLPEQIQRQIDHADHVHKRFLEKLKEKAAHKRGPKPLKQRGAPVAIVIGETYRESESLYDALVSAIGKPARGNKRQGRRALYADLVMAFAELQRLGITLPRNKSLSARACMHGLGEVLRRHGCTEESDLALIKNANGCRLLLGKCLDDVFSRVANALENKLPPH